MAPRARLVAWLLCAAAVVGGVAADDAACSSDGEEAALLQSKATANEDRAALRSEADVNQSGYCCWWPQRISPSECYRCENRGSSTPRQDCKGDGTWCYTSYPPAPVPGGLPQTCSPTQPNLKIFGPELIDDFKRNTKPSEHACEEQCQWRKSCRGWSWYKIEKWCHLYEILSGEERNSYYISGYCGDHISGGTACSGPEYQKDPWESQYNINNGERLIVQSWEHCRGECERDSRCVAWTWKTDSNQCWMKSHAAPVDTWHYEPSSISGICKK